MATRLTLGFSSPIVQFSVAPGKEEELRPQDGVTGITPYWRAITLILKGGGVIVPAPSSGQGKPSVVLTDELTAKAISKDRFR